MKKIICLLLAGILTIGLLAACGKETKRTPQVILTATGGKEYTDEVFSYYAHYARDLFKGNFMSSAYSQYLTFDSYLNQYYEEQKTTKIADLIIQSVKDQFENYILVKEKFAELNLTLSEDTVVEIEKDFNSFLASITSEQFEQTCEKLGMTKEQFKDVLYVHPNRQLVLRNHFVAKSGPDEISSEQIADYYSENYVRFRYIFMSFYDSGNNKLALSEIAKISMKADELYTNMKTAEDFTKAIEEHSSVYLSEAEINERIEAYKKTKSDAQESDIEEYRKTLEEGNAELLDQGMICTSKGRYTTEGYESYNSTVDSAIMDIVNGLEIGEFGKAETDTGIWLIERCDPESSEDFLKSKRSEIISVLADEVMEKKYTFWKTQMKFEFVEDVVNYYDPRQMEDVFLASAS